jgi:hypothetical protein
VVPAVNYSRSGGSGRPRGYRALPLWAQWVIPFAVAAAVVIALVVFVNYETNQVPVVAADNSAGAVREQNREDTILVQEQQAPKVVKLKAGESPAHAIRAAVVGYMTRQIAAGAMDGPIKSASCKAAGSTTTRLVFHCSVTASAQVVTYPFDGVVQPASRTVTYCQRVAPPIPSMNVPVSRRCL